MEMFLQLTSDSGNKYTNIGFCFHKTSTFARQKSFSTQFHMEIKGIRTIFREVVDSDFSKFEGTNCYCSEESRAAIRRAVSGMPLNAIHRIGTGDYHYVTLFWAERITEPFILYLFDNHPDDQPDAFGENILSCGSWMKEIRKLPFCKGTAWIDGKGEEHSEGEIKAGLKAYVSIDLDILSHEFASTDWDQGEMTLDELTEKVNKLRNLHEMIGADICGGLTPEKGATPADISLNVGTEEAIIKMLKG